MSARWTSARVALVHGIPDKRLGTGAEFDTLALGSIWTLQPTGKDKLKGDAILPSLYNEHDAREHKAQRERGEFVALIGDVDKGDHAIGVIADFARSLVGDGAYLIHSTANAFAGDMRWRLILPLDEPFPYSEWKDAQEACFDLARAHGIVMDGVTERAGQVSFLPNVPKKHDKTGEPLRGGDGKPLYYASTSTSIEAAGLRLDAGPIAAAVADLRCRREQDERSRAQMRAQAERRRASQPVSDAGSVIEAFNRTATVAELLQHYGYEQSLRNSDDWRSPHQTSGTFATRVFDNKWVSLSGSDSAAGLGTAGPTGCFGDAYDLFVHYEHAGNQSEAWKAACREQGRERPAGRHPSEPPPREEGDEWTEMPDYGDPLDPLELHETRRQEQRKANVEIGEGTDIVPTACIVTLDEMIEQYVFIKDGSQVAPLDRPHCALALADFKNTMAASKHWFEADGKKKSRPVANLWIEDPRRKEADALTFRAGGDRMTRAPDSGRAALNLWVPLERAPAPDDWAVRALPFVHHVEWLWGDGAGSFLDWLAHIEQDPGILPHYGWVHISREHGKGRNWISSVVSRVWTGHVAASLDLVQILDGGFNGRMSRKTLAIVDEINEGGNSSYRHAQKLRQIVTEEHREINPKYGRQRVEYNSCRWLMFSNHTGALPLTVEDRRFWIVAHEGPPRGPDYYKALYGDLRDPLFIASVSEFLRRRDIRRFAPGAHPPMTAAKRELIAFGQSEDESTLRDVADHWPSDLITALELTNLLQDGGPSKPATRHIMDRVGIRKVGGKTKIHGQGTQTIYAIRSFARWSISRPDERSEEVLRVTEGEKRAAIGRDDVQPHLHDMRAA